MHRRIRIAQASIDQTRLASDATWFEIKGAASQENTRAKRDQERTGDQEPHGLSLAPSLAADNDERASNGLAELEVRGHRKVL